MLLVPGGRRVSTSGLEGVQAQHQRHRDNLGFRAVCGASTEWHYLAAGGLFLRNTKRIRRVVSSGYKHRLGATAPRRPASPLSFLRITVLELTNAVIDQSARLI